MIQVVENLLENAVKFSPTGGGIAVRVRAFGPGRAEAPAVDGRRAVVQVADQGPGVPLEQRQRVFERFVQLDPPRSATAIEARGVGLGLAICREIVEAHDGDVWVAENRPQGSVFGFSLPLAADRSD